jgi:hypothetical protein
MMRATSSSGVPNLAALPTFDTALFIDGGTDAIVFCQLNICGTVLVRNLTLDYSQVILMMAMRNYF